MKTEKTIGIKYCKYCQGTGATTTDGELDQGICDCVEQEIQEFNNMCNDDSDE